MYDKIHYKKKKIKRKGKKKKIKGHFYSISLGHYYYSLRSTLTNDKVTPLNNLEKVKMQCE